MAIPNKIEKFKDLESDFGTTVAAALWKKAADHMDYVNQSNPIGMLLFFRATQENVPSLPDSKFWKLMDGTPVSNVLSPYNGMTFPDLRVRFLKHPAEGDTNETLGGSDTQDLTHNHGGVTGATNPQTATNRTDASDAKDRTATHTHTIANASGVTDIKPPYRELQIYVRIV